MKKFLFILIILIGINIDSLQAQVGDWTHFVIDHPLPGRGWGTSGPALGDFDQDGDLDVAVTRRTAKVAIWYEYVNDSTWIPHLMADATGDAEPMTQALGAAVLDIDHDGDPDIASNKVWFENPGNLLKNPDAKWPCHAYEGGGHDIVAADVNGDGKADIITDNGSLWFNTSDSLRKHVIFQEMDFHGGIAPKGYGDMDNDRDVDIVIPGFWYENPGDGEGTWLKHEWPHKPIPGASYGTSTRTWLVDIDNDGDMDIIYSDCDTGGSHVFWVENLNEGMKWRRHQLDDPPVLPGDVQGTGSFHSLGVADFDLDGDLDIFAGEQEDPDTYMVQNGRLPMKPEGLKERGVIWENTGKFGALMFRPIVIQRDNPGWHDVQLGDVDGDGDIDMVSKVWNADAPAHHADYWRNDAITTKK